MKNIIVLGGKRTETLAFTAQFGMKNVRHVVSKDSIRGLRPDEIHFLPGYFSRPDRHAINAELRHMRRRNTRLDERIYVVIDDEFRDSAEVNNLDIHPESETPIGDSMAETDVKLAALAGGTVLVEQDDSYKLVPIEDLVGDEGPVEAEIEEEIAPVLEKDDFFDFLDKGDE